MVPHLQAKNSTLTQFIAPHESRLYSVDDLISKYNFAIPGFQRLYAWGETQWQNLIDDLHETAEQGKSLFLGLAVVGKDKQDNYLIIDGQQRLTTIALLLHALGDHEFLPKVRQCAHEAFIRPQDTDASYFFKLLFEKNLDEAKTYSQHLMSKAVQYFHEKANGLTIEHVRKSSIIVYCAESIQKGTAIYERVNLRGLDIAKIEIIKSRLFDIAGRKIPKNELGKIEDGITIAFKSIYEKLNPPANSKSPINLDAFLSVHWILYKHVQPKTTDFVKLYDFVDFEINRTVDATVAENIWCYIRDLDQLASVWRKIASPAHVGILLPELREALLSLQRVGREGSFTPLIAAALSSWGETKETVDFIRFCEVVNFRHALVGDPSHSGRSRRWGIARGIMRRHLDYKKAVNAIFWETCPWWSAQEASDFNEEDDLPITKFAEWRLVGDSETYHSFRYHLHYFFWEYARWLSQNPIQGGKKKSEDMQIFKQQLWEEEFRKLEIEHIFPQKPDKSKMKYADRYIKKMRQKLHSLGNLTLIPPLDNKELRNNPFNEKISFLRSKYKHLNFNAALEYASYTGKIIHGVWSIENCEQRSAKLIEFAQERWGIKFLRQYPIDISYEVNKEKEEEDEMIVDLLPETTTQ
ncbi:MAG: DUF262 domain-containing HNH endonuclease family protein [Desulfovibrio sp.]|jgi:hypothetical protein|nr:DUF262 domain-containing HNH endonuclease family protein [Desulfovibrio sp.]